MFGCATSATCKTFDDVGLNVLRCRADILGTKTKPVPSSRQIRAISSAATDRYAELKGLSDK